MTRLGGVTQQEIGDTLGVDQKTVANDIRNSPNTDEQPDTRTDSRGQQRPASIPTFGKGFPKV